MKVLSKTMMMVGLLGISSLSMIAAETGVVSVEGDGYVSTKSAAQVKKLIAGKTFYFVDSYGHAIDGVDWNDAPGWGVIRFNKSASSLTFREFPPGHEKGRASVKVLKNGVKIIDPEGTCYSYLSIVKKNFLQWEDEGYSRFFKTKAAARTYLRKLRRMNMGFPPKLAGKTFYTVFADNYEHPTLEFGKDTVTISEGGEEEVFPYQVKRGVIYFGDGDNTRVYLRRQTSDYVEATVKTNGDEYHDATKWFNDEYGQGVAAFHNDARKLAKFFVKKGLMGHKVTADGRILGKPEGYWRAEGNELHFSIGRGEILEYMAFRLEGVKLYLSEWDAATTPTVRFYTDPDKADAFLRQVKAGDAGANLQKLIVGKKLYLNEGVSEEEKRIEQFSFLRNHRAVGRVFDPKDGKIKIHERFRYRIIPSKHQFVIIEGKEKEYHRVIDHSRNWIEIRESDGTVFYLYTNRLSAIDGIVDIDFEDD